MHTHSILSPEGFTRPKNAAEFCGVSIATYWRWAGDGRAPKPIPVSPGVSLVRNSDLLAWQADPLGWAAANANTPPAANDDAAAP